MQTADIKLRQMFKMMKEASDSVLNIYNNRSFDIKLKPDDSPVTDADKASSRIINENLKKLFPDVPVLDEEIIDPGYETRKGWNRFFMIDPLDGTREFLKRNGEFCINLALIEKNKPIEGWIFNPLEGFGWYCKRGEGIYRFDETGLMEKAQIKNASSSVIRIVTSRSFFRPLEEQLIEQMRKTMNVEIIHMGSSLKQVEVALGSAGMYLKGGPCSEWDTAPGQLMVEQSGGAVLTLDSFSPMIYNKQNLLNPHFVMLGKSFNNPSFKAFLKTIMDSFESRF